MNEIDQLSTGLFEEAKRFLEKATAEPERSSARDAYAHAALLLGFSSLESHVNAIAEELTLRSNLDVLDRSILTEREVALQNGRFELTNKLKIYRFEDRVAHILANFSGKDTESSRKQNWWASLMTGIELRNKLVHPKAKVMITTAAVSSALQAVLECLNALYLAIYSRPLPIFKRGLQSTLTF
jgi:hypothetical protein